MRRRALLASLSPLALAGLVGLVALAADPETTVRLATQLGQSALDTGRGVASYLSRAAPLSTALFAALAWVAAGSFRAFVAHRDPADTRTTAEHAFALVASATVPLVVVFARDRPVVVAGAGARGRFRLGATVSALAFAVPAWSYFPPAAEAAGFDPESVGLAVGFAVAATLLSLPFAAIGYATTRTADAERRAGPSPAASAAEQ
ncbi:hypothetical protein [Haloferax massiliensis]|uniref:Uncharacterized protein n=1 Tax=Haloferax massiliensis TaxID=1476858 RepID=A0A0D6JSI2_9EURY|nr:hypothetical protein [Haloferax massiliensis]CQR50861.1 hypothetical protein BN996_02345 [Haloferax massiliensis]